LYALIDAEAEALPISKKMLSQSIKPILKIFITIVGWGILKVY
jgi:hypothetical protein